MRPVSKIAPPITTATPLETACASPHAPINVPAASAAVRSSIKLTAAVVKTPVDKPNKTKHSFRKAGLAVKPESPNNRADKATKMQPILAVLRLPKRGTTKKPATP